MFSKNRNSIVLFLFLALVFSCLDISKVFIIPHCLAFDVNDDANHTFINLQQWRRIFAQGEWPMMNVYNNFGTPLSGDVITYPLSPLAITYAFLPGPVAMTVNRALIAFVSLLLLFIFYHRRFPKLMSIGLGLCTFYGPGFLWHSAHHHFQMSLLVLTAFFLLQERFTKTSSLAAYLGMCALSIVMFMSISFNIVIIMCVLITGYQIFLSGTGKEKNLWIVVSALICGMIAALPDILLFSEAAARSIRKLAQYPIASFEGPNKIFWTPIVAAIIYSLTLFGQKRYREAHLFLWLGIIPFGTVLLSRALPFLWKEIPFLGATDVVRLTWGANIFLMMASAGLLLRWLQLAGAWRWEIFICLLAIGMDAFSLSFRADWLLWGKGILAAIWVLVCFAYGCWILGVGKGQLKEITVARWMTGFVSGAVVVFYLYYGFFNILGFSFPRVCHLTGHPAFSVDGSQNFILPKVLDIVPKNSRVAYDFNTILGLDLRGAKEGLFSAGARSTIMTNADFGIGLFNKGLVQFDNYTGDYHFGPPWSARELQQLGIAYVVQQKNDKTLLAQGWKQTTADKDKGVFVYQNPLPTGVVFLKNGEDLLPVTFTVWGNGLNVPLPLHRQGPQELVISLLKIPGWRVWVDDRRTKFNEGESPFLTLTVLPQDHFVRVRYEPFSPVLILFIFLLALAIPCFVIKTCL